MPSTAPGSSRQQITLRPGVPDFSDLPWTLPLDQWYGHSTRLVELERGLSRHTVLFVNYHGQVYVLKELPVNQAEKEYQLLKRMEDLRLPAVAPAGHVQTETTQGRGSVLITRYLEQSLPYRSLFMRSGMEEYRDHLLDAMAGLLVQLHLTGILWGDCSLSNTLFRRDAGALQAYLVDAETAEFHPEPLAPALRLYDLEIMHEEVNGDLADLRALGHTPQGVAVSEMAHYIRVRYQNLWEEITREETVAPEESFRIQERIRALNALGFSVGEVALVETGQGEQVRLRVVVTDRNFHRDQLHTLTGLLAEERQAQQMMNEIQEVKAKLSYTHNRSTPLSVAAYFWLEQIYQPVIDHLGSLHDTPLSMAEIYCQVLEHKWYLSEKAQRDVGHQAAAQDYLEKYASHP
jgi:hypothetical protein